MFQTFISRHNSNFFSDKLVLTSVTPASSAPVLQTPKATSSTLYFDSLTVNAGNGGFLHSIQMDTSVNSANLVVFVVSDMAFDADPTSLARFAPLRPPWRRVRCPLPLVVTPLIVGTMLIIKPQLPLYS